MTNLFNLINSECQFSEELINAGITHLRNADFQRKGLYYQAFTSLSVGLERLLKLIIILDNYNTTKTLFTETQLRGMGHNLNSLFQKCINIANSYCVQKDFSEQDDVYNKIINILSEFADRGTDNRYFNLNYISQVNLPNFVLPKDTTHKWYEEIDKYIYNNKISAKNKNKISQSSNNLGNLLNTCSFIQYNSETNTEINNGIDFCFEKNKQLACQKYRVLFVAQIVRYLSKILNEICDKLQSTGNQNIPYLSEYFIVYRCEDSYLLKKKNFIK